MKSEGFREVAACIARAVRTATQAVRAIPGSVPRVHQARREDAWWSWACRSGPLLLKHCQRTGGGVLVGEVSVFTKHWPWSRKYWFYLTAGLGMIGLPALFGFWMWLAAPPSDVRDVGIPALFLLLLLAPIFRDIRGFGFGLVRGDGDWLMKAEPGVLPMKEDGGPPARGEASNDEAKAAPRDVDLARALFHAHWLGNDLATLRALLLTKWRDENEWAQTIQWQSKQAHGHVSRLVRALQMESQETQLLSILTGLSDTEQLSFPEILRLTLIRQT